MKPFTVLKFLLLLVLLSIILPSCEKDTVPDKEKEPVHLNIAVFGNSYSNDSYCYLPFILKEYGITCNIHIYYKGSGSLHDLEEQWYDNDPYGLADLDNAKHMRMHFSIDTRIRDSWKKEEIMSADDILALEEWDIISLQQGGKRAKDEDTYYPYLGNIIERIDALCDYPYAIAWFMAYNAGSDNANEESLATQKIITERYPFDLVFPVATAIFSCQNCRYFSELGDSKYKKMYASDNVHLQEGIPCYIAALSIAEALLREYSPQNSVIGNKIRPTTKWLRKISCITPNGESTGVSEENCSLAQKAAVLANDKKFEISIIDNI